MPSSVRKLSTDSTAPTPILTTTTSTATTTHHPNNVQGTSTHQLISSRLSSATTFTPIKLTSENYDMFADAKHLKNELNLGRLDGLVSSPNRSCRVRMTDSKKIAAILLETNTVELQRHLLTLTVQNQVSSVWFPLHMSLGFIYSCSICCSPLIIVQDLLNNILSLTVNYRSEHRTHSLLQSIE